MKSNMRVVGRPLYPRLSFQNGCVLPVICCFYCLDMFDVLIPLVSKLIKLFRLILMHMEIRGMCGEVWGSPGNSLSRSCSDEKIWNGSDEFIYAKWILFTNEEIFSKCEIINFTLFFFGFSTHTHKTNKSDVLTDQAKPYDDNLVKQE